MNTFVGNKKGFSEPVLVKVYENSTIERIGFVTNEDVESLNIKKGKEMYNTNTEPLKKKQGYDVLVNGIQ